MHERIRTRNVDREQLAFFQGLDNWPFENWNRSIAQRRFPRLYPTCSARMLNPGKDRSVRTGRFAPACTLRGTSKGLAMSIRRMGLSGNVFHLKAVSAIRKIT